MFTLLSEYAVAAKCLAVFAFLAAIAFGFQMFRRHEQQIGYDRATAEYTKKALQAEIDAARKERELNVKLQEAQNAATERDTKIKELSDSLNATSNRLRDTISALRHKLPRATPAAQVEIGDTALAVFGECQKEYLDMAEKADRHASDVKMLEDAWPK